jgi:hypothetical protein
VPARRWSCCGARLGKNPEIPEAAGAFRGAPWPGRDWLGEAPRVI